MGERELPFHLQIFFLGSLVVLLLPLAGKNNNKNGLRLAQHVDDLEADAEFFADLVEALEEPGGDRK
jgi:hypothetical protein